MPQLQSKVYRPVFYLKTENYTLLHVEHVQFIRRELKTRIFDF